MKFTQKTFISNCNRCYSLAIFFMAVGLTCQVHAQYLADDITLTDTVAYTDFGFAEIANMKYPPSNLFDGKLTTCWVSNPSENNTQSVFMRIPDAPNDSISLSIFSGYGKSKDLFVKNSRPREITLHLYSAYTPDGYVSEMGYQCKAFPLPESQRIVLKDTFGIQQFRISYTRNEIKAHGTNHLSHLKPLNLIDTMGIMKFDISGVYEGTRYKDDDCISEIFFDNCYAVMADKQKGGSISHVYLNETEDALWIDKNDEQVRVYADSVSTLQIIQQSNTNEWAILIAMPKDIGERAEATYLLFDLIQEDLITDELQHVLQAYDPGEPLYLEHMEGKVYVVNESATGKDAPVELRHYFY